MHKNKIKTTGLILLCLVLTLILPMLISIPIISSEQKENDEKLPTISAAPDIIYINTYTIAESADDAWTNNAGTDYTSDGLELGGHLNANQAAQKRICLRWNLSIPQNARIIDAYINLTVKDTSTAPAYNGITANIQAFDSSTTPPFNYTTENIKATRTRTAAVISPLASSYSQNDTAQTSDISSIVQTIVNRADWVNNSIFGVYIHPTGVTATPVPGELIEFWSYDAGNSTFYPKLYVEWEESPYFIDTPTDLTIQNGTLGYYFEWSIGDDNPDKYIFSNNVSGIIQEGDWQSGDEFKYDIPALAEGIYNYTIYINDTDGNYDEKHVIVNVTYLNLPTISDLKFIQNGEERDNLICGDGPFTMQISNNSAVNTIDYDMIGFCPKYNMTVVLAVIGPPTPFTLSPWSNMKSGSLSYNASEGDYFQGAPASNVLYMWELVVIFFFFRAYKAIQNIDYNVRNYIWIDVNSGSDFIYNGTVHSQGGTWDPLVVDILNIDITTPSYESPTVTIPDDSSKNFEVQIKLTDEAYGSGVREATLYYSSNSGASWGSMDMLFYEDLWVASIPPQSAGTNILYKVVYKDLSGNVNTTLTYEITALDYGDPSILVPGIITIVALVGAIGAVALYRNRARIVPKLRREASLEKKLKNLEQRTEEVGEKLHKIKNQQEEI